MSKSILVVGSVNMDLVLKTARAPKPGESFIGDSYAHIPGGKGANQAVAAARLGARVTLAGRVGGDANGISLKAHLEAEGISTSHLVVDVNGQTGLAVIILEADGQNRIIVFPGANMQMRTEDVRRAFDDQYDAVMLQFEAPREVVVETCRMAMARKLPVVVDAGPAQPFPLEDIAGIDILSPNETEAEALTGMKCRTMEDAARAAAVLAGRSRARWVVIKMGEQGALLYDGKKTVRFPAFDIKPVDTTAAGDAFTAGMMLQYLEHGDIARAVGYGNAAGALAAMRLGAQPSLPAKDEVAGFLQRAKLRAG